MELAASWPSEFSSRVVLVTEIPSFEAGLIAFVFFFFLMGIMFYVLRSERDKPPPPSDPIGPNDVVVRENPLSRSDAPFLAIVTLVILELTLDILIVVSVLQGVGSVAVGTMLAIAAFLAAGILGVYRSTFMEEAFTRKPRLEAVAASLSGRTGQCEDHD